MSKRLSDTDKWKKPFMKQLPPEYKLFWLYLVDDCDIAGVWHVDFEVAEIRLGIKLSVEKALRFYQDKVVVFDNGTKWFVQDFISFQYGNLTPKNKMYNSVTLILNKYNLMGHLSPINGGKDKDKVKDKVIGGVGDFSMPDRPAPNREDVQAHFVRAGKTKEEADKFYNHYAGLGWKKGITPIINWAAFANNWMSNDFSKPKEEQPKNDFQTEYQQLLRRNAERAGK